MAARVRAVLPSRWFPVSRDGGPSATPVLDGVLAGFGATWAAMYSLLSYTRLQTRIATATNVFLDLIAGDFFGTSLLRRSGETDAPFRSRIQQSLFAPRATRAALIKALTNLTGRAPAVFEPAYTYDTGGYGTPLQSGGAFAYGMAGGYGSLLLPFQCFLIAYRPRTGGIANVAGYLPGEASPSIAPGAITARQASATYLDEVGAMQTAGPGVVRPLYSNGVFLGLLLEPASENLIPASLSFGIGWATYGNAPPQGNDDTAPILAGAQVVKIPADPGSNGGYWPLPTLPAGMPYAASVWVYLLPGFSADAIFLEANNGGTVNETQAPVNQAITGAWQRVALSFPNPSGGVAYTGFRVQNGAKPSYWCCEQFEAGSSPSSYIPTTAGAATRDADALSNNLPGVGCYGNGSIEFADLDMAAAQVTDADIQSTIVSVLPAATIAWTRISD